MQDPVFEEEDHWEFGQEGNEEPSCLESRFVSAKTSTACQRKTALEFLNPADARYS
jgi:hypothetical protein